MMREEASNVIEAQQYAERMRVRAEDSPTCGVFQDAADSAAKYVRKVQANAISRAKNATLREVCGTSAAAARRDMGI